MPAADARSQGVAPLGSVWSKKPWVAMARLKSSASSRSALFAATGLQPTLARSSLTSLSTCAWATASSETAAGALGFAGSLVAGREGVVGFGSALGGVFGFLVFDGVPAGAAGFEAGAEVEGEAEDGEEDGESSADAPFDGDWAEGADGADEGERSVPRLVAASPPRPVSQTSR